MALASRVPVNRRITMMLVITSMPLSWPDPGKAADPATTAAPIATPPSMPIAASVSQDSIRAIPARRTQSAGPATGPMPSRGVSGAQTPGEQRDHGVSMCFRTV